VCSWRTSDPAECPLRCKSEKLGSGGYIVGSIAVASVTEVGGQQRQLRLDIGLLSLPLQGA